MPKTLQRKELDNRDEKSTLSLEQIGIDHSGYYYLVLRTKKQREVIFGDKRRLGDLDLDRAEAFFEKIDSPQTFHELSEAFENEVDESRLRIREVV